MSQDSSSVPSPSGKTKAVAYYRASERNPQRNSVAGQREQVRKWAADHGVEIVAEIVETGPATG